MNNSQSKRVDHMNSVVDILFGLDEDSKSTCVRVAQMATELRNDIASATALLQKKKSDIEEMKEMSAVLDKYKDCMIYVDENLPDSVSELVENQLSLNDSPYIQNPKVQSVKVVPVGNENNKVSQVPKLFIDGKTIDEAGTMIGNYVTTQEFNTVHKYMRGRLTVADINSCIDLVNSVLKKKYDILKQARNSLKGNEQDWYVKWKRTTKEAGLPPGTVFCNQNDFIILQQHKLTKNCFSKLVVLRHLKRIREVRCGPETLYVI